MTNFLTGRHYLCAYCNKPGRQPPGAVNRAKAAGLPIYCDRICAGLGRRKGKSDTEKKEEKRIYDQAYRAANLERILAQKAEHHKQTYDPAAARETRKLRMPWHVGYCRRPEYQATKREYDRNKRDQEYGAFAKARRLLLTIENEIRTRATKYEIRSQNNTGNKATKRRREFAETTNDLSRPGQNTYGDQS